MNIQLNRSTPRWPNEVGGFHLIHKDKFNLIEIKKLDYDNCMVSFSFFNATGESHGQSFHKILFPLTNIKYIGLSTTRLPFFSILIENFSFSKEPYCNIDLDFKNISLSQFPEKNICLITGDEFTFMV